ncbi:SDR family oxidoreductase [Nocardia xishanensis]|uniref:SDR family oxidoreductase n=1 Tax=Nocardia xishanensis TaxID=238964 RepID=A0ABW7WW58_9NOCA
MSNNNSRGLALVTGGSAGIGAATAETLTATGYSVIAAARRLPNFLDPEGTSTHNLDVGSTASIDRLAHTVADHPQPLTLLVANAGIPCTAATIADSDPDEWRTIYDTNVVGVVRCIKAFLPDLTRNHGHIIVIGSTVGRVAYERGAAYAASKHAVAALVSTLRLELNGTPVRVSEIAPGMMRGNAHGGEFMHRRFGGDRNAIDAVYAGVPEPLTPADIADCISWVATRPPHVDIDLLEVRPLAQAAQHKVHRLTTTEASTR